MLEITEHALTYQYRWSQKTFGPGSRLKGVLEHFRKELVEVEKNPVDISEWADLLILTFDGALRQGFAPEEVIRGYYEKMVVLYGRTWPDWREFSQDEAIEHTRTAEELALKSL